MILAGAALARSEVELEVGVAMRCIGHRLTRGLGERRATKVRVHDHPRRVEHASHRAAQARARAIDEVGLVAGAGEQLRAALVQLGARDGGREPVDGRQGAQALAAVVGPHARDDPRRGALP